MIKDKRLQAVRVGKEYRITEDQIRQYVEENKT
jgi:excisionase family DNA binding protein